MKQTACEHRQLETKDFCSSENITKGGKMWGWRERRGVTCSKRRLVSRVCEGPYNSGRERGRALDRHFLWGWLCEAPAPGDGPAGRHLVVRALARAPGTCSLRAGRGRGQ